ncbi:MAG TPA: hypothetical protein DHW78_10100 [Ruminococcaceae bacterium]|nr:hypothetical protein [Oscillospiraceae bacterium]
MSKGKSMPDVVSKLKTVLTKYENYFQVNKISSANIVSDAKAILFLLRNDCTESKQEQQLKNAIHNCIKKRLNIEDCFDSLHELYGYFELINWEIDSCNDFAVSALLEQIINSTLPS